MDDFINQLMKYAKIYKGNFFIAVLGKQGICSHNRPLVREKSLIPSHIIDESMSRFLQTVIPARGLLQLQQAR